jgi:hypothetical protein
MNTAHGHLTYCSNIHPGEKWQDHFKALRENIPFIRESLAPGQAFGLGLRIANEASIELSKPEILSEFKTWLDQQNVYVFVINGFPYGGFHNTTVKDDVHTPDWTTDDRLAYSRRLFHILAQLLPEGMEGGVSTPPLSYRLWWPSDTARTQALNQATANILLLLDDLIRIENETGKYLHLDIEPEPDGLLDNTVDFVRWYSEILLPEGTRHLTEKHGMDATHGAWTIRRYIQLCYDICHAAVGFESPADILHSLHEHQIRVGRIQVSSALRVDFTSNRALKLKAIETFDEPVYLHQVVTRNNDNTHSHFPDLPQAIKGWRQEQEEWRIHFHVPLFIHSYGVLDSTQDDILKTLAIHKKEPFSPFLEVETYTWGVLPADMQKPIGESIVRELEWVKKVLEV